MNKFVSGALLVATIISCSRKESNSNLSQGIVLTSPRKDTNTSGKLTLKNVEDITLSFDKEYEGTFNSTTALNLSDSDFSRVFVEYVNVPGFVANATIRINKKKYEVKSARFSGILGFSDEIIYIFKLKIEEGEFNVGVQFKPDEMGKNAFRKADHEKRAEMIQNELEKVGIKISNTGNFRYIGDDCKGNKISQESRLETGHTLCSSNRKFIAQLQEDRNFVVYKVDDKSPFDVMWHTNTYNKKANDKTPALSLDMQSDCNLVLQTKDRTVAWHSQTYDDGTKCYALLQDDGNFVIYSDETKKAIWSSVYGRAN